MAAALARLVPCWPAQAGRGQSVDKDTLIALMLDKSVPVNAIRLGALRALGMPEQEIREKLAMPRRTYYDAVRILAQNRR